MVATKVFIMLHKLFATLAVSALGFLPFGVSASTSATAQQLPPAWQAYISQSKTLHKLDEDALKRELKRHGLSKPITAKPAKEFGFDEEMPLAWYNTDQAKALMEAVLSYQTPSGGWSKRTNMTQKRRPGMAYGTEKDYIPTFDNNATSVQLKMLAKAFSATGDERYRSAFERGFKLILQAQFPSGGWPQTYPLVGGYHNMLTYNDNLISNLMQLLDAIAQGADEYAFTSPEQRQTARNALTKGLDCILATQVIVKGKATIWGAQHDPLSLLPVKARAFEMASLSAAESANLVLFLMKQKNPSPALTDAIYAAVEWFESTKIAGKSWTRGDRGLKDDPQSPGVWARFYELDSNKPVFGDRDNSVHYVLGEISQERINGYGWYGNWPAKVLAKFPKWSGQHPRATHQ